MRSEHMRHLTDAEIQSFLDGETVNREAIAAHLNNCPECRAELSLYRKLYHQLAADDGFLLSAGFADTVLQKVAAPRRAAANWLENGIIIFVILAGLGALLYLLNLNAQLDGMHQSLKALADILKWMTTRQAGLLILSGVIVTVFGNLDKLIAVFQHRRAGRI